MDKTELRLKIQTRKSELLRKRACKEVIDNDKLLNELNAKLAELSGDHPLSPLLESALKEFIDDNLGYDNLDRILKKHLIDVALVKSYGNQSKAARILGIDRGSLRILVNSKG